MSSTSTGPKNRKTRNIAAEIAERIVEYASTTLQPLQPPPMQERAVTPDSNFDPETFVLLMSDLQAGHETKSFNFKVLEERMQHLIDRTLRVTALHRKSHEVPTLELFLLGDLVHGERVGITVGLDELEDTVIVQIFDVVLPLLMKAIEEFAANFDQLNIRCVSGNHGVVSKMNAGSTNWDLMIYKILALLFRNYKNVKFDIAEDFYLITEVEGWKFLLAHGDQIPMYLNIPMYGITMRSMRWQKSIEDFDILTIGHFHNFNNMDWNGTDIIINGTFVTDDEFVRKVLGLKGSCCQVLMSVHPRKRITFTSRIQLV